MGNSWKNDAARLARVQRFGGDISDLLNQIKQLHKDDVKITLIVRNPNFKGRDTVMTDDDPKEAVKALESLFADPTSEVHFPDSASGEPRG